MRRNRRLDGSRRLLMFALVVIAAGPLASAAEPEWWDTAWSRREAIQLPTMTQGLVRLPWPSDVRPEEVRCVPAGSKEPIAHWSQWMEMGPVHRLAAKPNVHEGFPRVVRTANGRLLLFYRAGRAHASGDSSIVSRTSQDEGASWSDERRVWAAPTGTSAHNPVALVTPQGRIILWMSRYVYSDKSHERQPCVWCWSDDNGETWTDPVPFDRSAERSCYYVTDAIATSDGLLASDASFPPTGGGACYTQLWHSVDGVTWKVRATLTRPDENMGDETALLETEPGTLLCLLRNRRTRGTLRLWSRDAGRTWSDREDLGEMIGVLQRPFLTRLDRTTVLLTGRDRDRRLVVAYLSRDNGQSFGQRHVLDSYQSDGAYTSACPIGQGSVLLTWYTDQGARPGQPDIKTASLTVLDRPKALWMNLPREYPAGPSLFLYHGNSNAASIERRERAWTGPVDVVNASLPRP